MTKSPISYVADIATARNGHPNFWDTILGDRSLLLSDDWPPKVVRMIARLKVISEDLPRQREVAATFATGTPSLEWLVQYRRRQFSLLWLEYACLPTDAEKDAFCDGLVEWWPAWCANEDRAAEHIAEHRRRAQA